jgi:hypothetical protein
MYTVYYSQLKDSRIDFTDLVQQITVHLDCTQVLFLYSRHKRSQSMTVDVKGSCRLLVNHHPIPSKPNYYT